MTTKTKLKRYQSRMSANINAMLAAIHVGHVNVAGNCAMMAAHYARSIAAIHAILAAGGK